jgi:hypothetical protein
MPSVRSNYYGSSEGFAMAGNKLIIRVLAAIASATIALILAASAHASPVGPCAEVPYVGVCVPIGEQPPPPTQHNFGEVALPPDTSGGSHAVN